VGSAAEPKAAVRGMVFGDAAGQEGRVLFNGQEMMFDNWMKSVVMVPLPAGNEEIYFQTGQTWQLVDSAGTVSEGWVMP
jgi:hypothetical protein